MKLTFLGAAQHVTGSCYLLEAGRLRLLIDCGMFQERSFLSRNWEPMPVAARNVDYLLLTHAHLDHSGLIPKLVRDGFAKRILSTPASKDLAEIILMDAVGRQLPATVLRAGSSGVIMLPIPKRGLLREVQGIEAASAVPGVTAVEITAPLDHEIVPLPEGSSYLGFVFARGDDPGEVESALRKAHRELRAVITDPLLAP